MSDKDTRPFLAVAGKMFPSGAPPKTGHVVAAHGNHANTITCDGGAWVPAWVWISDEDAVKEQLLRGSEE